MFEIPISIEINGKEVGIRKKGDYRVILDCITALQDEELPKDERAICSLFIFYDDYASVDDVLQDEDLQERVNKMMDFIACGDRNEDIGQTTKRPTVFWEEDSFIICSAINKNTQEDIRFLEYLHWWTFIGKYMEIGDSTFATIVSIRNKKVNGTKLDKWENSFVRDNPKYFNIEAKRKSVSDVNVLEEIGWNKTKKTD